jgi:hypothetical protein
MATPSQDFVDIKEIRDGILILKDDSLRAVIMVSSVNIALKSEDEQRATMNQFLNFLNTLEFSTEIVVQSRMLDIGPYITSLEERLHDQKEELLQIQTKEYIEFIKYFTNQVDVMIKNFFVVVPYVGAAIGGGGNKKGILGFLKRSSKKTETSGSTEEFEFKRSQLEQRISVIQSGLTRLGVRATPLNTEQAVELFHNLYNPGGTHRQATFTKE